MWTPVGELEFSSILVLEPRLKNTKVRVVDMRHILLHVSSIRVFSFLTDLINDHRETFNAYPGSLGSNPKMLASSSGEVHAHTYCVVHLMLIVD